MSDQFDLRLARVNAGLSQRALAEAIGVPFTTIQRLEGGEGATPANAKKVADWAGISVVELLRMEARA